MGDIVTNNVQLQQFQQMQSQGQPAQQRSGLAGLFSVFGDACSQAAQGFTQTGNRDLLLRAMANNWGGMAYGGIFGCCGITPFFGITGPSATEIITQNTIFAMNRDLQSLNMAPNSQGSVFGNFGITQGTGSSDSLATGLNKLLSNLPTPATSTPVSSTPTSSTPSTSTPTTSTPASSTPTSSTTTTATTEGPKAASEDNKDSTSVADQMASILSENIPDEQKITKLEALVTKLTADGNTTDRQLVQDKVNELKRKLYGSNAERFGHDSNYSQEAESVGGGASGAAGC